MDICAQDRRDSGHFWIGVRRNFWHQFVMGHNHKHQRTAKQ